MTRIITILFVFISIEIYAQPGGGGGLNIENLYSKSLKRINIFDENLKIRYFVITDTSYKSNIFEEIKKEEKTTFICHCNFENENSKYDNNQRIELIYKEDTMIVDFLQIMPANPMGIKSSIDSLVIMKGYFRYYRNPFDCIDKIYDNPQFVEKLSYGITPYTLKYFFNFTFNICPEYIDTIPWEKRKYNDEYSRKIREMWYKQKILSYENTIDYNLIK